SRVSSFWFSNFLHSSRSPNSIFNLEKNVSARLLVPYLLNFFQRSISPPNPLISFRLLFLPESSFSFRKTPVLRGGIIPSMLFLLSVFLHLIVSYAPSAYTIFTLFGDL